MLTPYLSNFMPPVKTEQARELTLAEEASTSCLSARLQDLWTKADEKRRHAHFRNRRRREEQADEFRLILLGIKPPAPATIDAISRSGWDPKEISPDRKALMQETQRARGAGRDQGGHRTGASGGKGTDPTRECRVAPSHQEHEGCDRQRRAR